MQGGKTKFTVENATKTRVVLADSKIHILGAYQNIRVCRCASSPSCPVPHSATCQIFLQDSPISRVLHHHCAHGLEAWQMCFPPSSVRAWAAHVPTPTGPA